jgi:hypothetical protein
MLCLTTNSSVGLSAMVCNYALLKLACNSRLFTKNGRMVLGMGGGWGVGDCLRFQLFVTGKI